MHGNGPGSHSLCEMNEAKVVAHINENVYPGQVIPNHITSICVRAASLTLSYIKRYYEELKSNHERTHLQKTQ